MTTTPETSLDVNVGLHRACTACAKPRFHSLAPNAPSVRSNQGKTHAIRTWLYRPIWYCRGPRIHDNDTGDVARGQSLEVNAGPLRACTTCAKPSFHSLARNAPSVRSNEGKAHAIHTWFSRAIWYCRGPRKHGNVTGSTGYVEMTMMALLKAPAVLWCHMGLGSGMRLRALFSGDLWFC